LTNYLIDTTHLYFQSRGISRDWPLGVRLCVISKKDGTVKRIQQDYKETGIILDRTLFVSGALRDRLALRPWPMFGLGIWGLHTLGDNL